VIVTGSRSEARIETDGKATLRDHPARSLNAFRSDPRAAMDHAAIDRFGARQQAKSRWRVRMLAPRQLDQPSVAGVVVGAADPPVAVMPVKDGIEKYAPAQASGAEDPMAASSVKVTASGLLGAPLAATVSGAANTCELPLTGVAKFQVTVLGVAAIHPGSDVARAFVV
jgi:hypothetical protein